MKIAFLIKSLILVGMLAFAFGGKAEEKKYVLLTFDNIQERRVWLEWYLDRDGEEQSGFFASDWTDDTLELSRNKVPKPEEKMQFTKR